jgi:hypothetical protein
MPTIYDRSGEEVRMTAQFKGESDLLHRVVNDPDLHIRWTGHAELRMAQYGHTAEGCD